MIIKIESFAGKSYFPEEIHGRFGQMNRSMGLKITTRNLLQNCEAILM